MSGLSGAVNAYTSDQMLGIGSASASQVGLTGYNATFYNSGATIGHGVALVQGIVEVIGGGGGEVISGGAATPIGVPFIIHGLSLVGTAGYKLLSTPLDQPPPAGGAPRQRSASDQKLIDDNKALQTKQQKAKEITDNKQAQTTRGNTRTGQSNQGTRGSHTGGNKPGMHDKAEARRAREQAAADDKKAAQAAANKTISN